MKIVKAKAVTDESEYVLTDEEVKKVADHFNKHIGNRKCEVCGHNSWFPLSSIVTPVTFNRKKNHHMRDRVFPLVMVVCKNCGNSKSFAASSAGITLLIEDDNLGESS